MSVIRGLGIATRPWIAILCSSRLTVLDDTGVFRCRLSSVVTFSAVVFFCHVTIRFKARRFLSYSFVFRPLLCFADPVLPCTVYAVMTSRPCLVLHRITSLFCSQMLQLHRQPQLNLFKTPSSRTHWSLTTPAQRPQPRGLTLLLVHSPSYLQQTRDG